MIRPPRPAALSIRCPWCGAQPGNWCYKVLARRQGKQPVSFFVHPTRADTVTRGGYQSANVFVSAMGALPDVLTRPASPEF